MLFPTDFQLFYLPYHVDPIVNIAQLHEAHIDILHVLAKDFKELDNVQDKNRLRLKSFLKGTNNTFLYTDYQHYFLWRGSEDTDSFLRPFARLEANTLRPFTDAMRSLKPCLFLLFRFDGWKSFSSSAYFSIF